MDNIRSFLVLTAIIGGVSYGINYLITKFKLISSQFTSWVVSIYLTYLIIVALVMDVLKQWISDGHIAVPSSIMKQWIPSMIGIMLFLPLLYTSIIVMTKYALGLFVKGRSETFMFLLAITVSVAISVFVIAKIPTGCQCGKIQ